MAKLSEEDFQRVKSYIKRTGNPVHGGDLIDTIESQKREIEHLKVHAGCGCGLCLTHNNMKCPKLKEPDKQEENATISTVTETCGYKIIAEGVYNHHNTGSMTEIDQLKAMLKRLSPDFKRCEICGGIYNKEDKRWHGHRPDCSLAALLK